MLEAVGNLWTWITKGAKVVVPTNVGYNKAGLAVMGAGLALQAARSYPDLPAWYGAIIRKQKAMTPTLAHPKHPLILFPTKPWREDAPHLAWDQPADLWLIEGSLMDLCELPGDYPIALPLVGCGCGGLSFQQVEPVLRRYLKTDRFTVVRPLNK